MAWSPFRRLGRWFVALLVLWLSLAWWRRDYVGETAWPESLRMLALLGAVVVFALGWSLRVGTPPDERRGALRYRRLLYRLQQPWWLVVDDDNRGVTLSSPLGRRQLDRRELISACVVEQQGPVVVEWHLTHGRRLAAGAESYYVERERLERLGLETDQCWRGYLTRYRSPFRVALWASLPALLVAVYLGQRLGPLLPGPQPLVADGLFAATLALLVGLTTHLLRMRELSIGPDGLAWETTWRRRRLSMAQIAHAAAEPQRLSVGLRSGETLLLRCPGLPGTITAELAEMITRLAQHGAG